VGNLMFSTERLQLAIYLHASGRLQFTSCERIDTDKVRFIFDDPEHVGDQLELEFEQGAQLAATSLFASQKYLRRKMSDTLNNRRNREHEYNNR
jgi:hypothetical protein